MSDLHSVTTAELQAEIKRRADLLEKEAQEARERHHAFILKHIDALLLLVPSHSRTSCSDTNAGNYKRCTRCTLMEFKSAGWISEPVELKVYLEFDSYER